MQSFGDATLVSTEVREQTPDVEYQESDAITENVITNDNVEENTENQEQTTSQEEVINKEEITENTEVLETVQEDTYFTTSKLDRENIYSQTLETYQEIYNNTNSTAEQKSNAIQEIAKINKQRNAIMIAENLCLAKGFENIVIFANGNSISVIVKAENLEADKIAQIQNIVSRELEVGAENINISTK